MGSICAQRGGGCPGGSSPPRHLEALSHLFLCVHGRIYIPLALLLSQGSAKGPQQTGPLPPGPRVGVQVPACYNKEEGHPFFCTKRMGRRRRSFRPCRGLDTGKWTWLCVGKRGGQLSLLQRILFSPICWCPPGARLHAGHWGGHPCPALPSTGSQGSGSTQQGQENKELAGVPSSTVCKTPSLPCPGRAPTPQSCRADILQRGRQDPLVAKNKDLGIL